MTPPAHITDANTPYHQLSLQVIEQREKIMAMTDRVVRVEQQVGGILTTVREDIRDNYTEIKDTMEKHRVSTESFMKDVYGKLNGLTVKDAARSGASSYSWKLIAAFGAVATVAMGIGSFIWFLAKHIPT